MAGWLMKKRDMLTPHPFCVRYIADKDRERFEHIAAPLSLLDRLQGFLEAEGSFKLHEKKMIN